MYFALEAINSALDMIDLAFKMIKFEPEMIISGVQRIIV